jgi:hypothetical protein
MTQRHRVQQLRKHVELRGFADHTGHIGKKLAKIEQKD